MEKLGSGGVWTRPRGIPRKLHYIMRNCAYTKYTKFHVATAEHRVTDTEKVLKYTFTKTETWWDLNPHCSGGWRCNHIMRINPFAKTRSLMASLLEVAAVWLEKSWLDLNGKIETGWDLNPHPFEYRAKDAPHYAKSCFHQVHQVPYRYYRASRHRYRKSTEIYIEKHWGRAGFEPTPVA